MYCRIRHGYAHVVNNVYLGWRDYAIGGSMGPSVKSEGNLFVASGTAENRKVFQSQPFIIWVVSFLLFAALVTLYCNLCR